MSSFVDDFKSLWNRPDNTIIRLITINVFVFLLLIVIKITESLTGQAGVHHFFYRQLALSSSPDVFIYKPWTLFTYFFVHRNIFDVLFNMLVLYWMGNLLQQYMGGIRVLALYLYGGIAAGLIYLLAYNTVPFYVTLGHEFDEGAFAGIYAIFTGAAVLLPNYRVHLLLFGPVPIKYISAIYIVLAVIGYGHGRLPAVAGGVLMGFLFVWQYRRGYDWSRPLAFVGTKLSALFAPRPRMKVSYRSPRKEGPVRTKAPAGKAAPTQDEIDAILDKIHASGYENLTTEEKQALFRYSQRE